ncbi:hypothetical protein B0A55_06547 [Friedmanniomyces simplex]|uniref:SMODS and SLOG-associating 2TM effector domain-containing protein n=1 Tax=Friedmanniomyces simplex TaxID=329884 RepID=A0A4U0XAE1_9PEZI|nr:hypothetical protein B0A55_06547 [Friedmanniomyces simplex]
MAMQNIDLEKQPMVEAREISPSTKTSRKDSLYVYQTLIGDVHSPPGSSDDSLYHGVLKRERKAQLWTLLSGIAISFLIAAQIILCLGITIGAQVGLTKLQISILAGVNTGVAASIAVLKGLGLPEKKIVERHKLQKLAEKIRYTTRRIQAGLDVDAAKEAEDAFRAHDEVEDEAMVLPNVADVGVLLPAKPSDKSKAGYM